MVSTLQTPTQTQLPTPNTGKEFPLGEMPADLLLDVTDFLPTESAAALSLCCKGLQNTLGNRRLSKIRTSQEDNGALLELLAVDMPNKVACSYCGKLHDIGDTERFAGPFYTSPNEDSDQPSKRLPKCVLQDLASDICSVSSQHVVSHSEDSHCGISLNFGTALFKMVMKRYHQQLEYKPLLDLMSGKIAMNVLRSGFYWLSKEECRIVKGRLLHRLQIAYFWDGWNNPFRGGRGPERNLPLKVICSHGSWWWRDLERKDVSENRRCGVCHTEYRWDIKNYQSLGRTILLTRWKDLGEGPDSEVFKTQFRERVVGVGDLYDRSISSAFEGGKEYQIDSLMTPENRRRLLTLQTRLYIGELPTIKRILDINHVSYGKGRFRRPKSWSIDDWES
jgi:hypothetical protein